MKKSNCIRVYADIDQINTCKDQIAVLSKNLGQLSQILNLAGNQVRLSILYLLQDQGKLCVCDLSDILDMKVSAISQHLRKLKDVGMVSANKTGQTVFYSLNPAYYALLKPHFTQLEKTHLIPVE